MYGKARANFILNHGVSRQKSLHFVHRRQVYYFFIVEKSQVLISFALIDGLQPFFVLPEKQNPCSFWQWGDEAIPNCYHVFLSVRTVKRDGANQGRLFCACSKGKDDFCGYFESKIKKSEILTSRCAPRILVIYLRLTGRSKNPERLSELILQTASKHTRNTCRLRAKIEALDIICLTSLTNNLR